MLTRRQFLAGSAIGAPTLALALTGGRVLCATELPHNFALCVDGKFKEQVPGKVEVFSRIGSEKPDFILTRHGFAEYPKEFITQALTYEPLAVRMILRLPNVIHEYIRVEGTWVDGNWVGEEWLRVVRDQEVPTA
jgi:hypothetical protein